MDSEQAHDTATFPHIQCSPSRDEESSAPLPFRPPRRRTFGIFVCFVVTAGVVSQLMNHSHIDAHEDKKWKDRPRDRDSESHGWLVRLMHVTGIRRITTTQEGSQKIEKVTKYGESGELKVVEFRNEQIPGFLPTVGTPIEAAEALACRSSVTKFVVNATDLRDECEGLTKAFEKTCSESQTGKGPAARSRRLQAKLGWHGLRRLRPFLFEATTGFKQFVRRYLYASGFFFAEDAVAGDAYTDAQYAVENGIDEDVYRDLRRLVHRNARRLEAKEIAAAANSTKQSNTTQSPAKPILSLELPNVGTKISAETLDILNAPAVNDTTKKASETTEPVVEAPQAQLNPDAPEEEQGAHQQQTEPPYEAGSVELRTCCVSILNVYRENCTTEPEEDVSDTRLSFVVTVMMFCCVVKSLIRHFKLLWIPEAAGCIIVGVLTGYSMNFFPHHDISFDGNWFLRILVPPIIFEAALHIDKRSFNRHIVPILLYAIVGTLMATIVTAFVVHRGSAMLGGLCSTIPYVEALTFGALISSIDPIAVLSVLSNMGMTDTDTIYVVIFGESLLNDGVAIVLFNTLVHFLDESLVIDAEAVTDAAIHFCVVAFGSLLVGVASGMMSTVYFWMFYECQAPMVEVLTFFCWALLPYYFCDGIGWSGIVAAVTTGFVMDLYIVGEKKKDEMLTNDSEELNVIMSGDAHRGRRSIFSPKGHLSDLAKTHIGFVAELIATTMETAIFAYLGLFLFSHRYHWNMWHTIVALLACCISRAVMIPSLSLVANWITRIQQYRASCRLPRTAGTAKPTQAGVRIDRRMQLALWFAGLRGAMSFALVEHIPLFDEETKEGTRLKPELKAMTSASIMFTVFILGGATYYVMEGLGVAPAQSQRKHSRPPSQEMVSLLRRRHDKMSASPYPSNDEASSPHPGSGGTTMRRAWHTVKG